MLLLNYIFLRVCQALLTSVTTCPVDVSLGKGHSGLKNITGVLGWKCQHIMLLNSKNRYTSAY